MAHARGLQRQATRRVSQERCGAARLRRRFSSVRPLTTSIPVVAGGPTTGWVTESEWREQTRVPYVDSGEAKIWYTKQGTGFPVLTLAPGGMRSSVPL